MDSRRPGVWTSEPSTIRLVHPYNETFVVLEGAMRYRTASGRDLRLAPGDAITIPRGSTNEIVVEEPVRKLWIIGAPEPLGL